jgi:hypothetical protein
MEYMANQPSVKLKLSVVSSDFTKKGKFQSQVVIGTICSTRAHSAVLAIGRNQLYGTVGISHLASDLLLPSWCRTCPQAYIIVTTLYCTLTRIVVSFLNVNETK